MNDLNAFAPITTVKRRRQQRLFRAWQKFQQKLSSRQQFLQAVRCGIRFTCIGEFQRLLPPSALVLRLQFVLRLVCDAGILRAERYFVILVFVFVILDVLEVISEK